MAVYERHQHIRDRCTHCPLESSPEFAPGVALKSMKMLVALAAAIEIPTALVLIAYPALFTRLLFGADVSAADQALGPLAGFALIALAVACWPSRNAAAPPLSAVLALLAFSLLCVLYLAYYGATGARTGLLLWPAAAGHAVVALLLLWCSRATRAPSA